MIKYKYNEFPSDIFIILEALEATLTISEFRKKFPINCFKMFPFQLILTKRKLQSLLKTFLHTI